MGTMAYSLLWVNAGFIPPTVCKKGALIIRIGVLVYIILYLE